MSSGQCSSLFCSYQPTVSWLGEALGDSEVNEIWQKALFHCIRQDSIHQRVATVEMLARQLNDKGIEYEKDIFLKALSLKKWQHFYSVLLFQDSPGSRIWKVALTASMERRHLESIKWMFRHCNVPDGIF